MLKSIMNTKVNYKFIDNDKDETIVLLHGWGQNIDMMLPIGEKLDKNYNCLYIDLPGFGHSLDPDYAWSVYDYAKCINELVNSLKIKKIIIIGHSFGGRIALIYASIYDVKKIVLLASPFKKEITKLSYKTKVYKKLKNVPGLKWIGNIIKKHIGSTDYNNANEIMRGVLVKSINVEMIEDIKKIKCPTLLIWGVLDTAVPIERAYELKSLINNSKLIAYEDGTHYTYLEHINEVVEEINKFIK